MFRSQTKLPRLITMKSVQIAGLLGQKIAVFRVIAIADQHHIYPFA